MQPARRDEADLPALYRRRFGDAERKRKDALWKVLCADFLQRYVGPSSTVIDLGAGYGEFINNIRAAKKIAVDLNEDTADALDPDVTFALSAGARVPNVQDGAADVVFASNFFEHMLSKAELMETLREIARLLHTGGRLLVLQPNIRFAYREYWDYFDHHVALSDRSLAEAVEMSGFRVTHVRPRFLPYTTKSKLPQHPALLRLYLRLPPLQWLFGKQMFLAAERTAEAPGTARSRRSE
jgi:SAM-dependent methyltransferase